MSLNILVVEDTFQVRQLIVKIVRHMYPDATITGVSNGRDAMGYAVRNLPSLIITDLDMPSVSGYDLMVGLQGCVETREIPCVVVTSHADRAYDNRVTRELEQRGLPNVPVVAKPLDIAQFCKVVTEKIEARVAVH